MKLCIYGKHFAERELDFARELRKHNINCIFICNEQHNTENARKEFPCCLINTWKIETNLSTQLKIIKFLKKTKPDLFLGDTLFPGGFIGCLGKLLKIPCLIMPTGQDVQCYPDIPYGFKLDKKKRFFINLTTKFIDGYLFFSNEVEKDLYKNWNINKKHRTWNVPFGHSTPSYKEQRKSKLKEKWKLQDKIIISTLSRLHPIKGIEYLIKAMPKILSNNNNFHLVIGGNFEKDYYKKKLDREISSLKLENNITFTGDIYGKEKEELFLLSDIFIISSIAETGPTTLLEAFHYGLPVISTPVGLSIDLIKNNKNGFLTPKNNSKVLAKRIVSLYNNNSLRKNFTKKGKIIADKHKWDNCINDWIKVLNKSLISLK